MQQQPKTQDCPEQKSEDKLTICNINHSLSFFATGWFFERLLQAKQAQEIYKRSCKS
jgi:hypothetical protein